MVEFALLMALPMAAVLAAVWDLLTYTIPNRISAALVALFFATAVAAGMPTSLVAFHVFVGIGVLAAGFALFTAGAFGGGDAKLLAALALWMGPTHVVSFIFLVCILGGVLASVLLTYRSQAIPRVLLGQGWAHALHERKAGIPYGVAIAAAALVLLPSTGWFAYLV